MPKYLQYDSTPHEIINFVTGPSERIASLTCITSSCILFVTTGHPHSAAKSNQKHFLFTSTNMAVVSKQYFNRMYQRMSTFQVCARTFDSGHSRKLVCLYNGHFWQCAGLYCTRFLQGMPHLVFTLCVVNTGLFYQKVN